MPFLPPPAAAGKKRRRGNSSGASDRIKTAPEKASVAMDSQNEIDLLETQIYESRRYYNNIAALISLAGSDTAKEPTRMAACVALCRVYSKLLAAKSMTKSEGTPEEEVIIIQWLQERYDEYTGLLLQYLHGSATEQNGAITLLFQLVRQETSRDHGMTDLNWKRGLFVRLVDALIQLPPVHHAMSEFLDKVNQFDDVRYHTFSAVADLLAEGADSDDIETLRLSNCVTILSAVDPSSATALPGKFFSDPSEKSKSLLSSLAAHRKQAQRAWMEVFRGDLSKAQRKHLLGITTRRIVPWFKKPELLSDFLADCFNVGGSSAVLALSGMFDLIQRKNLDYPSFYPKLYSLLDDQILHSKNRSQFFRLLDKFLSSTHLPAALVASFIKRMSRLALHGPPAGIVVVIPFVYNLLKMHPVCTFMIHREVRDPELRRLIEEEGMEDPFDMEEKDPMETGAIDSCLWEIVCLQSHYHPNVATLAKIISEQFTKQSYNLEDFLDHSYTEMIEAELSKSVKKAPEVEPEIPKTIFTEGVGLNSLGALLSKAMEVGPV